MSKRLFSGFLVLVFAMTLTPFLGQLKVFAANWEDVLSYETNSDGTGIIITSCDFQASGALAIPEVIDGLPVTEIGDGAFFGCIRLTNVEIPDSVTSIGMSAFKYCDILKNITLPHSLASIGDDAFAWCDLLEYITIPENVTHIGRSAFVNCHSLLGIYVSSENTKYSSIDGVLFNKSATKLIQYPAGLKLFYTIPNSVVSIGHGAFLSCNKLEGITIPNSVEHIEGLAFYCCSLLMSVEIPDSVVSIGRAAFSSCPLLTDITIHGNVTNIGQEAFYNTAYYKDSTNWQDGILYIDKHLIKAEQYISKSDAIKEDTLHIADNAFESCGILESIIIPDSVTSIGTSVFSYCGSLFEINVDKDNISYCDINGVLFNKSVTELVQYPIGKPGAYEVPSSVTSIMSGAFKGSGSLTSITIGDNVISVGDNVFYGCWALTDVIIGDGVKSIEDNAFSDCSSLENITIGNSVSKIGYMAFSNCISLTEVNIPNSATSIDSCAFFNCCSLTSVILSDRLTSIGSYAFCNNSSLAEVIIPYSVIDIGEMSFGYVFDSYEAEYFSLSGFLMRCYADSAGYQYAIDNDFEYEIIKSLFALNPDMPLKINIALKSLSGISAGATVSEVLSAFISGDIEVFGNGEKLEDSDIVCTGYAIKLKDGNDVLETLTIVVQGDLDGDGEVNVSDARKALRAAVGLETINIFQTLAADVDGKAGIGVSDARMILRAAVDIQGF